MKINSNFNNVETSYLFSTIAKKIDAFLQENPDKKVIRLGIGDVTRPLCPAVISALHSAVDDMSTKNGFHGYGPEQGYPFIKNEVQKYYQNRNVDLEIDEIFISDGAKSDAGNILDLFDKDNVVLIPDPVYPVYRDTNIMDGRKIVYMNANESNSFLPMPDSNIKADLIYLCSPNNPTGATYNKEQLKAWVDYALANDALILFDAAYEAFIVDDCPHSIYEIENAKKCAVEICSLSKTAGFTGTRCGYTIVPFDIQFDGHSLNKMWLRRQTTKFNGVSYVVQKGAAAVFSPEGQKQIKENLDYYKQNAKIISDAMDQMNIWYTGGKNSPYIWFKCPKNMYSWDFFDLLLTKACVVGTPGAGFGKNGDNFFRLTAFGNKEDTIEAVNRIKALISSL
ncbi:MAG: LL-diaminopimelate aminotransferase [Clostridia bacterium]|nr:LL-diaminopimelate aminotransferase [Clostridia bacterium]